MTSIPWLELLTNTLVAFCGLSLHGLVFAMLLTQGKEITRAGVARYFAFIFIVSLALSVLATA